MVGTDEVASGRRYNESNLIISIKDMWNLIKLGDILPGQVIMCGNEDMIIFRYGDGINIQQNVENSGICGLYKDGVFYDHFIGEISIEYAFERIIDGFKGQDFI